MRRVAITQKVAEKVAKKVANDPLDQVLQPIGSTETLSTRESTANVDREQPGNSLEVEVNLAEGKDRSSVTAPAVAEVHFSQHRGEARGDKA